jgi:hypothetical protein
LNFLWVGLLAMSSEVVSPTVYCGNCGEPVATRFCTHCQAKNLRFSEHPGAPPEALANQQNVAPGNAQPVKGTPHESAGWTDVIDDVMGAERHKLWVTTRSLLRSPVATTLSLTENGEYTGHFKLMATRHVTVFRDAGCQPLADGLLDIAARNHGGAG